jgi:ATP-dependent RNA helicase DDX41
MTVDSSNKEDAMSAWKQKREARRKKLQQETKPNEDELQVEEEEFVPLAKRRRMEQEALLKESNVYRQRMMQSNNNENEATEEAQDKDPEGDASSDAEPPEPEEDQQAQAQSLLESAAALHESLTVAERADKQRHEEEARILQEASKVRTNALQAASEKALGLIYTESLPSTWTPPKYILKQGVDTWNQVRKEWHMDVEGDDIPPPLKRFQDMKFPKPILQVLEKKGIKRPTPIQMQGLTVALASRDMIGIAFTGSGKTLTFALPMIMAALEEELRMPLCAGEGPIGIILAPSRELARQTFDVVDEYCKSLSAGPGYPELRAQLLIGGESAREQMATLQSSGIHCVVATPGRLRDVLKRKTMSLSICRYICLDEADRMLDLGFDEEVGEIMNHFPHQRQTLLFSATFPKKFQDFARETLVNPVVVNVGRAGAANLDVIQEVEYVKQEAKIVYLLHCLQKTAPPVVIFCERKGDVDDIHEYLLLKGVEAVSIHGGKVSKERKRPSALVSLIDPCLSPLFVLLSILFRNRTK